MGLDALTVPFSTQSFRKAKTQSVAHCCFHSRDNLINITKSEYLISLAFTQSSWHPHCSQSPLQHPPAERLQDCFKLNQNISLAQTKPGNFAFCSFQLKCSFLLCEQVGHNPSSFGRLRLRSTVFLMNWQGQLSIA